MVEDKNLPHWQLYAHDINIGIRGFGRTLEEAFEEIALALTAIVTDPKKISQEEETIIYCAGNDLEFLLMDWLNSVIYEMIINKTLFSSFKVKIENLNLKAVLRGERLSLENLQPTNMPKGIMITDLKVQQFSEHGWMAQSLVEV